MLDGLVGDDSERFVCLFKKNEEKKKTKEQRGVSNFSDGYVEGGPYHVGYVAVYSCVAAVFACMSMGAPCMARLKRSVKQPQRFESNINSKYCTLA
jgi:hypothetical protein